MTEYEFTAEQNKSIDRLRQKLWHIALMLSISGAFLLINSYTAETTRGVWGTAVPALCFVVMGFVFFRPLDNLKRITATKGHDILEMMIGMDDLRIAFATAQVVFIVLIMTIIAEIARAFGF